MDNFAFPVEDVSPNKRKGLRRKVCPSASAQLTSIATPLRYRRSNNAKLCRAREPAHGMPAVIQRWRSINLVTYMTRAQIELPTYHVFHFQRQLPGATSASSLRVLLLAMQSHLEIATCHIPWLTRFMAPLSLVLSKTAIAGMEAYELHLAKEFSTVLELTLSLSSSSHTVRIAAHPSHGTTHQECITDQALLTASIQSSVRTARIQAPA